MEKRFHFQQMVQIQLVLSMEKNANRSILISLYKTQVQVDQGSPYKNKYAETNRREKNLEHMDTGEIFQYTTLLAYALRLAIDK